MWQCVCWSLLPPVGGWWCYSRNSHTGRKSHSFLSCPADLWPPRTHTSLCCPGDCLIVHLQFSFPFVETHAVSAVRIRHRSLIGCSEDESEEEGDSKTSPIIQSEGASFPWNIDGELVEIANEVLVKYEVVIIIITKTCYTNTSCVSQ